MVDVTAEAPAAADSFAIGDTLGRSLAIYGRRFGAFVLLSGLFTLPYLVATLASDHPVTITARSGLAANGLMSYRHIWPYLFILLQSLATATVIAGAFEQVKGAPWGAVDGVHIAAGRIGPIVGVNILQTLAITVGTALLIVPGLILMTLFYVALPICIVERQDMFFSMNRSVTLTQGHRWKIFGVALVLGFLSLVVGLAAKQMAYRFGGVVAFSIVDYLVQVLYLPFAAIVATVVYQALRTAKEGPAVGTLAEVFA